jgi:hypothetical protein
MTNVSKPRFILIYKGVNISKEFAPESITITYTDKVHGEADEIEVTVQDKDGKWRGPWCPEHGDIVDLYIGYESGMMIACGAFEVDEPCVNMSRSGDTLTFRGVSAPISKSLRTRKTRGYEKQNLKAIASKIAGEHGLLVTGNPPDILFERVTQRRERDLEFLSRLAENYGAYFSVRGKNLVFEKRSDVHARGPVFTLRANSDDYISVDLKKASHKTYSKAKLTYFEGQEKRKIEAEASDAVVKNGDTLRLDERVENDGQANARVKSELDKENLKKQTGTISMVGLPLMLAGQIIELDGGFGKWAGRYVIKSSRHLISRSSYTTSIEINAV